MNFTPQQLAGGARYGRKVRVGNWYVLSSLFCLDEIQLLSLSTCLVILNSLSHPLHPTPLYSTILY